MPTIKWNRLWGSYSWPSDGDEWCDQAAFCNQPYYLWKLSIFHTFIKPYISKCQSSLEIAPGHGRWSGYLADNSRILYLVDLNPSCIDFCKKKFKEYDNIKYYSNDGKSLDFIPDNSIDFIWSYDSFVHMEKDAIESYFKEFSRILNKKGMAVIHHSGRKNWALSLSFLRKFGKLGEIYSILSLNKASEGGCRSNISKELIKKIAQKNKLHVINQVDSWGDNKEFNIRHNHDMITILKKRFRLIRCSRN